MKILQSIFLTGLMSCMVTKAMADTTLIFSKTNGDISMKMHITGNMLRATSVDDESSYMTYDANNKTFTTINHTQKEYYVMGEKEIAALSDMDTMVEKLLEEQLSEMPEAQRAMMRGMMKNMIKSQLPKALPKPEYTLTNKTASYNGYDCRIVTKKLQDDNAEFCVTDYSEIGMKSQEYAVITSFQQTIESMVKQFGVDQSMDFSSLGNFIPVHFNQAEQSGVLSEVRHDNIDPSIFAIPEDYTPIDLPF